MLEYLLREQKRLAKIIAGSIALSTLGCSANNQIPHFEAKYGITDENGFAHFVDNESGEFSIKVDSSSLERDNVVGAEVIFFDGYNSDGFYAQHPEHASPDFKLFNSVAVNNGSDDATGVNSNASLTLSPLSWQGWSLTQFDEGYSGTKEFVDWATMEINNGWGYHGCAIFEDIDLGHRFGSLLYTGAKRLSPVAAVQSFSENLSSIFEFISGPLETREAEECEAFHWFGFIPNTDEWVSPTGGIVIPYCVENLDNIETNTGDGIDNDCDGEIDEIDFGEGSNGNEGNTNAITCSDLGNSYFCDDFENNNLSSDWILDYGGVNVSNGWLNLEEDSSIYREVVTNFADDQFDIKLLMKAQFGGSNSTIVLSNRNFGGIALFQEGDNLYARCGDNVSGEIVYSDDMAIDRNRDYDIEISLYNGRVSAFIDDFLLFGQDNCFAGVETNLLRVSYFEDIDVDYVWLGEF